MRTHYEYNREGDYIYYYYGYINDDNQFIVEYSRKITSVKAFIDETKSSNEIDDNINYEYFKVPEYLKQPLILGHLLRVEKPVQIELPSILKRGIIESNFEELYTDSIPYVEIIRSRMKKEDRDTTIIERIYKPI